MTQGNRDRIQGNEELKSKSATLFFDNRIAREQIVSSVQQKWLTTEEAAQYLRVSANSIKTMVHRGKVRVHKLGRRNRFLIDELERVIVLPVTDRRQ